MDTQNNMMRNFIVLAEDYAAANAGVEAPEPEPLVETDDPAAPVLLRELADAVHRLRAHLEPADADPAQALGVEIGMQRAADLIESVIRRFEGEDHRG